MKLWSKLRLPLIQAPMAGGYNTVNSVVKVANAGCIGSFGFSYSTPEKIDEDLKKTTEQTKGIINANFFIFRDVKTPGVALQQDAIKALNALPYATSLKLEMPNAPYFSDLGTQLEPVWKHKPQVLTFHFGLPPPEVLEKAKKLGILVGITATTREEFLQIQEFGADFVVAQGKEAGGHRGVFDPHGEDIKLPLSELIPLIKPKAKIPIIATGGIMTGQDMKKFMKLGAQAIQMGTVFLTCSEAGTSPGHRKLILDKKRQTTLTNAFSGRFARGLENEFIQLMQRKPVLPFPIQNTITGKIRKKAANENNPEYQSCWVGENYRQCEELSVEQLIEKLEKEFRAS
jgi:nitronate monooxygenase